ncbi:MAG: putative manganese-dependent inorganic diphosphatase [Erysipelotrichaceae bacterium]|nr:putative manganese-dependent inorganic diphosphatase [Erysipelotrichaceae bacterium]
MKNPIYVTGHKNPDTDSIVSSIAFAEYKRLHGHNAIAGRVGPVRTDTEYLLERFGFEDPLHLYTAKCTIKEIEYDVPTLFNPDTTIKEAIGTMVNKVVKTAFVVNENKQLEGVLSISNLNELWTAEDEYLQKLLKTAKLKDIVKILQAEVLNEIETFETNGNVVLALGDDVKVEKNDIVITSSVTRYLQAANTGAGLIIVIGNYEAFEALKGDMQNKHVNVISTHLSALKLTKLIYQTPTVKEVMVRSDKVVTVSYNETVDDCMTKMSKSRFRAYPILDEKDTVIGMISRYHLVNYKKKRLILVDHNERKQSIDDIESGEVLEIIDHHRIGDLNTTNPISITTMVIGATATIVAKKYLDEGINMHPNMAGLLLGAILADTMNFNSPTTTHYDIDIAKKLEEISGVNADELYSNLVKHGESLMNRKSIDILYEDYKEFDVSGHKFGICQATCRDEEEFLAIKESLLKTLEEVCATKNFDLIIAMMTDTYGSGSYLMAGGPRKALIEEMYPEREDNFFVSKVVSRKKQLLPRIIEVLS